MTQTTKRRITIFPFFQADPSPSHSGGLVNTELPAPDPFVIGRERHVASAIITARGQRFSLRQIGSMFGSE